MIVGRNESEPSSMNSNSGTWRRRLRSVNTHKASRGNRWKSLTIIEQLHLFQLTMVLELRWPSHFDSPRPKCKCGSRTDEQKSERTGSTRSFVNNRLLPRRHLLQVTILMPMVVDVSRQWALMAPTHEQQQPCNQTNLATQSNTIIR